MSCEATSSAPDSEPVSGKRALSDCEAVADQADKDGESDDSDCIGPMPSESVAPKKQRVLGHEAVYVANLPCASSYERSFMHRDIVTHLVCTPSDFVVTASCDGHVKFWRKQDVGVEFVKHFRAHLAPVADMACSGDGLLLSTVSTDKHVKIFDVINFDMINMLSLPFEPGRCQWVYTPGDAISALAVTAAAAATANSGSVRVYDARAGGEPLYSLDRLHTRPVTAIAFNVTFGATVSADESGIVEYWSGAAGGCGFPKHVHFTSKLDTDLFEFARHKTHVRSVAFSRDGRLFATTAADRKIRVFRYLTGRMTRVIDESIQHYVELQQARQQLPNMEFGKRMAVERELEKCVSMVRQSNVVFDESGHFVMFPSVLGVKLVNLHTNRLVRMIGKPENIRFLNLALFQGRPKKLDQSSVTIEMEASDNPALDNVQNDPTLFCTGFKKDRFFLFSRREPDDTLTVDNDRDVFNEKPSKEDMIAVTEASAASLCETAIIHTSLGDIHLKLFAKECPKTVENFCAHSKNGYYNGHIFHRVIKAFMIQTGDPLGTGTGGESIWGGEFEDEFHPSLRHDRPYTVSMANAGPNTNGSQFFITLIPTPWLDNKHTVFGRCTRGMEVCQNIGTVRTNSKTDKPYDDITIISITVR